MPTQIANNSDAVADESFESVRKYASQEAVEKLRRAYAFAKKAHEGQIRKSGEPYIIHPARTVQILSRLHVDTDTLVAAYLHDVPEDTPVSIDEIEQHFGKSVAYLVDGITKLSKVHYRNQMEQRQVESLKKLFIHSAKDLRVILIKLADRLDNMRTLRFIVSPEKRMRIARETLEIYVPIANLLGIGEIRSELEDLCFEHLDPEHYNEIKREIEENMEERNFILEEMIHLTDKELKKENMEAEIIGRQKTFFSIHKKIATKKNIANIEDIIAIRIIVPTRKDCYEVLGIIHKLFKPKTGRIKDYIAVPKANGYRSIHTTVFGLNGSVVEFQIRTKYMHLEAEYGIAAHYFYKYTEPEELTTLMKQRASWIQKILDIQKEQPSTQDFIENLKVDVFQDRIFVFSPKGDVIDLPRRACALDFAYTIHTDIGNHASKALINGIQYPITATLSSGDTVKIMTSRQVKPEREWLSFVKTSLAANRIKEQLKREPVSKKILIGRKFLQKEFDLIGKDFSEELSSRRIKLLQRRLPYKTLDDILIAIGEGVLNPRDILQLLYEERAIHTGDTLRRHNGKVNNERASIDLKLIGKNTNSAFVDIVRTIHAQNIPLTKFRVRRSRFIKKDVCEITVLIRNYKELSQLFESLEQIDCIDQISRTFRQRKIFFVIMCFFTSILWLSHPFLIQYARNQFDPAKHTSYTQILIYGSLVFVIALVLSFKKLASRTFPELMDTRIYWFFLYLLTTLTLFTVIGEIVTLQLEFNWVFVLGIIMGIYALLTTSYITYKHEQSHPQ
ncbi:hypothetical protein COV82_03435 [Candidatus Peregrinibacteria bacterium CG11_big_fil_rev_8_21_14_0_20_46_8]|nr:MAG: hypothetical protein COV82_03435 [Candidatus Peregrinibacteria bacterium CG11_big_fil_rev_8_21_14_0_20_46_8]